MRRISKFFLSAILLSSGSIASIPVFGANSTNHDDAADAFFGCVIKHFNQWDLNHDGILTGDEVAIDIQNPAIAGEEAMALASIKTQERFDFRKNKEFSSFSIDDFKRLADGYRHGDKRARALVGFFKGAQPKLEQQSPELFAGNRPHISGIRQGHTSACYFLSAVAALAESRPSEIMNMIHDNGDGTYTVHFHNYAPLRVPAPTAGEVATYPDAGNDGIWLMVLEKAYGLIKGANDPNQLYEPIDAVTLHGGHAESVLYYLTGHKEKHYKFTDPANRAAAAQLLADAFAAHRAVTTGVPGHALAVVRFNSAESQVQIWNPWGTSREYKEVQEKMDHGCFWMPVADFVNRFDGMAIEQGS